MFLKRMCTDRERLRPVIVVLHIVYICCVPCLTNEHSLFYGDDDLLM